MAVICDNTGVPAGSETCKSCVSHGCDGYKQATKQGGKTMKQKVKPLENTTKADGIKSYSINTDTLGIKPDNMYVILSDPEKGYYLKSFDIAVDEMLDVKRSNPGEYYFSDIFKFKGPRCILGKLSHDLKHMTEKYTCDGLRVYIDNNYILWVMAELLIPEAYKRPNITVAGGKGKEHKPMIN
jgi:hypothetical protein